MSIHDERYNTSLAYLRDENGDYLVDAVINGYFHQYSKEVISRGDGTDLPVVQAGSYGKYFVKIAFKY